MDDISMDHPRVPGPNRPYRAILLPHRPLDRKAFVAVMLLIMGTSFVACMVYVLAGPWPVTGVLAAGLLLIAGTFYMSYRATRRYELVELTAAELKVTRYMPSGKSESWSFMPYWVRVEVEQRGIDTTLTLRQHGQRLEFGAFLTDGEKREFAAALREALGEAV
jgi:uncharacterized membrane protein